MPRSARPAVRASAGSSAKCAGRVIPIATVVAVASAYDDGESADADARAIAVAAIPLAWPAYDASEHPLAREAIAEPGDQPATGRRTAASCDDRHDARGRGPAPLVGVDEHRDPDRPLAEREAAEREHGAARWIGLVRPPATAR